MSSPSGYRLGSLFIVRLAGVPIEVLEQLQSPRTLAATRALIVAEDELDGRARVLQSALDRTPDLSAAAKAALRCAIRRARVKPAGLDRWADAIAAHNQAVGECDRRRAELETIAAEEEQATDRLVWRSAAEHLPGFGLFSSALLRFPFGRPPTRPYVRTALRYLQRVCAKNDTMSAYGPTMWGHVDPAARGVAIDVQPGIARRSVYFERWVVEGVAAALGRDPAARLELAPRVHPWVVVDARGAALEGGLLRRLTDEERALLARIDGETAAHAFSDGERAALAALAEAGVVLWQAEPLPTKTHGLEVLAADLAAWRPGPARARWRAAMDTLLDLQRRFAAGGQAEREAVAAEAERALGELGVEPPASTRKLYAARNALGEDCARAGRIVLGGDAAARLVDEVAPWYGVWRDMYSVVARRLAGRLREILGAGASAPLPAFLARAAAHGIDLCYGGLATAAAAIFEEIRRPWLEELSRGPDGPSRTLTEHELGYFRRRYAVDPVDEYCWPSIDVQFAAPSLDAVARGDYQLLLAELHASAVMLQYCLRWACPDPASLRASLERSTGAPSLYFGQYGASSPAHCALDLFAWMPRWMTFSSPERRDPAWRWVPPGDVEVHVDGHGDVRARAPDGRDLGSFAQVWACQLGNHPFRFVWPPHTPRLQVGSVIVQRETWMIDARELAACGASATRVERLRAAKGWPRFLYLRPTAAALDGKDFLARDKDLKPVFVDLESCYGTEMLEQWLRKFSSIECTEMLPAPDQIPWREPAGRYSFELRMLIEPGPAK